MSFMGLCLLFPMAFFSAFWSGFFGNGRLLISPDARKIDKEIPQNDTRALFFVTDLKGLRPMVIFSRQCFPIGAILTFFPRIMTCCPFLARGSRGRTKLKTHRLSTRLLRCHKKKTPQSIPLYPECQEAPHAKHATSFGLETKAGAWAVYPPTHLQTQVRKHPASVPLALQAGASV